MSARDPVVGLIGRIGAHVAPVREEERSLGYRPEVEVDHVYKVAEGGLLSKLESTSTEI